MYEEADPIFLRAIEIGKKTLGPDHPTLATWLNNRAGLLHTLVRAVFPRRKAEVIRGLVEE